MSEVRFAFALAISVWGTFQVVVQTLVCTGRLKPAPQRLAHRSFLINRVRIERLFGHRLPVPGRWIILAEKATAISLVTGRNHLLDLEEGDIAIAIGAK